MIKSSPSLISSTKFQRNVNCFLLSLTEKLKAWVHLNLYADPNCRYSDWSSCSYYCGDPRVEKRNKTLVYDTKESRAVCPPLKEEPCGDITCTMHKQAQFNLTSVHKSLSSEAEKPNLRVGIAYRKVFARPESFCAYNR